MFMCLTSADLGQITKQRPQAQDVKTTRGTFSSVLLLNKSPNILVHAERNPFLWHYTVSQ